MTYTKSFYIVDAFNHLGTISFKSSYLDGELAFQIFEGLIACEDVATAHIIDGTTGEITHWYEPDAEQGV